MSIENILNMTVGELVEYCDEHSCSACKLQDICIYKSFNNKEYTLISLFSLNIENAKTNDE